MSYLVCEKCSGRYKLKKNETIDDFEGCECGGKLKYVQNPNTDPDEELDSINKVKVDNIKNNETNSNTGEDKTLKESKNSNELIRAIAIIIGILIVLIPAFLFVNQDYSLLLLIIGGFVTSFIAGGKNEDGAINGAIIGLTAGFILLVFKGNFVFSNDIAGDIGVIIYEMLGVLLLLVLFSLVGGIIGTLTRNYLFKSNIIK